MDVADDNPQEVPSLYPLHPLSLSDLFPSSSATHFLSATFHWLFYLFPVPSLTHSHHPPPRFPLWCLCAHVSSFEEQEIEAEAGRENDGRSGAFSLREEEGMTCDAPAFFSLTHFNFSVFCLDRLVPSTVQGLILLFLFLSVPLFWVSMPPFPFFLLPCPCVSPLQPLSSLLWHNIRSEPCVLSHPLLNPPSSSPFIPSSHCHLVKGGSRTVLVDTVWACGRWKWPE